MQLSVGGPCLVLSEIPVAFEILVSKTLSVYIQQRRAIKGSTPISFIADMTSWEGKSFFALIGQPG